MSVWTRRSFLEKLGVGTAGTGLIPLLHSQTAEAQSYPKRLLMFHINGGVNLVNWEPAETSGGQLVKLGPYHKALAPYLDRVTVLSDLSSPAGNASANGHGHIKTTATFFTGTPTIGGSLKGGAGMGGISIDRAISTKISGDTRYEALDFGVRIRDAGAYALSSLGRNQPVFPETDPKKMFGRIFANFTAPSSGESPTVDPRWDRRQRVLDFLKGQGNAISRAVAQGDRAKLENHVAMLERLEKSLAPVVVEGGSGCRVPTVTNSLDLTAHADVPKVGKAQLDMIVGALSCDLTRVATMIWGNHGSAITPVWLGHDVSFHSQGHNIGGRTTRHSNLDTTDPAAAAHHAHMAWYGEQMRYLVEQLDSVQEGEGTLLDNTVIVYTVTGGHNSNSNGALLVGGKSTGLRTGRYVNVKGRTSNEVWGGLAELFGANLPSSIANQYFGSSVVL